MPTKTEPVAVLHLVFEGLALTLCKKVVPWAFQFQTRVVSAGGSPLARSPGRVPQLGLEVFIVFLSVRNEVGSWLPSLLFRKVCMRQRAPGVFLGCLGKWIPSQLCWRMGLSASNFLTAQMSSGY